MPDEQTASVEQVPCISLLGVFQTIAAAPVCVGNRWKCDNGHEWDSAHGGAWLQMPTTCPECGQAATAHMGRWQTLNDSVTFGNNTPNAELMKDLREAASTGFDMSPGDTLAARALAALKTFWRH
jgi:hypothetical protein